MGMKTIAIVVIVIIAVMIGWLVLKPHYIASKPVSAEPNTNAVKETSATTTDTAKHYTSAEVSAHSNAQSCWNIVNGKVYDLTSWINQHPGGSIAIVKICGIDGSSDFNRQHGGQSRPERELASFYIGVLK